MGYVRYMENSLPEVKRMLGRRIRALRLSRGMTQEQLGEISDTNYKYLGSIERGERNPSLDNLARIAGGLGISLAELWSSRCPYCGGSDVYRSKRRGPWEKALSWLGILPYRCQYCYQRYFVA